MDGKLITTSSRRDGGCGRGALWRFNRIAVGDQDVGRQQIVARAFVAARVERAAACKNLQAVPNTRPRSASDSQDRGTTDPDFPGSAAMCCRWCRPVTPEAAGSSPVDPANIHQKIRTPRDHPKMLWSLVVSSAFVARQKPSFLACHAACHPEILPPACHGRYPCCVALSNEAWYSMRVVRARRPVRDARPREVLRTRVRPNARAVALARASHRRPVHRHAASDARDGRHRWFASVSRRPVP